jgi:glycolate oxidase FAD binding subunit
MCMGVSCPILNLNGSDVTPDPFAPNSEDALKDVLAEALASGRTLEILGAGTKRGLGRPVVVDTALTLAGLSGITYYAPGELVMEAQAGTPMAEIEAVLDEQNQRLAFEPVDLGPLYGGAPGQGTIGGVFACNLAGPRRPFAGAARDHLLGIRAVSGRAEIFTAGGRVVKNVTGYDMGKLLAGSLGTLAVFSQVTFKVLPKPEAERTVLLFSEAPDEGLNALNRAAGEVWDISAGAHIGKPAAARSAVSYVVGAETSVTAVRLEGARGAVDERTAMVRAAFGKIGPTEELHRHNSHRFWHELRDGVLLPAMDVDASQLWRLTLPPANAAMALDRLAAITNGELLFDWLGGLVWLSIPGSEIGHAPEQMAAAVRAAAAQGGGHAVLMRATDETRRRISVFGIADVDQMALTRRIKNNFDPGGILNPGRMYEGC